MGQGLRDLFTLVRCGRFATGFPATIRFAHRTLGDLASAYERVVTPAVEAEITDLAERAKVNTALHAMSMKIGMAMLSYAQLAGCEQRFEVAALAGAATRLYDDLIDGSSGGAIDDRLDDLFNARSFAAASNLERLLADLIVGIRRRVEPIDAAVIALSSLHEYQGLSRRQRDPDVPPAILEKICRGKGAMANLTLCSLVKPRMEVGERELIMALGEAFQSLDDYIDVHLDAGNGIITLASLGSTTLADIGARMRQFRPALVTRYGPAATRHYTGMIYIVLVTAAVDRRVPALGKFFRRLIQPSDLKVFVIKGTDALPPAQPPGKADPCDG